MGALCLFLAAFGTNSTLVMPFFILGAILVAAVIIAFGYFSYKNPDYLRSEEYQIKKEALALYGSKGTELSADAGHVALIANPAQQDEDKS